MLQNFIIRNKINIKQLEGEGFLYEHKTGLKLIYIKNKDNNKVFSITFKTPADNDTGAFHILEHCVLCGSKNFNVKDPFNELNKGSLNTYLNAMTFRDKTMYPIASLNDKDFLNLMNVYLDAVFLPNVYREKEIFLKEGIHHLLDDKGGFKGYGGIVYNEMQGVYSDPVEYLKTLLYKELFSKSNYQYDSGGIPEKIPDLTYNRLLEYHRKYYHPSNGFLYLYGNLDIEQCLNYIDNNYLCNFQKNREDIKIVDEPLLSASKYKLFEYSTNNENEKKKYAGISILINEFTNTKLIITFEILNYYFFGMQGSPFKKLVINEGYGDDVSSSLDFHMKKPTYNIIIKNSKKSAKEFYENFKLLLSDIYEKGIDTKLMKAAIHKLEFALREENYGSRPKGLQYNILLMTNWLYGNDPFESFNRLEILLQVKKEILTNRFTENVIRQFILNSNHYVMADLIHVFNKDENSTLPIVQIDKKSIEDTLLKLQNYQKLKDKKDELEKIPIVSLSEIEKKIENIKLDYDKFEAIDIYHYISDTKGIAYVNFIFDCGNLPLDYYPALGILIYVLGKIDTKNYMFEVLNEEINNTLGGFYFSFESYTSVKTLVSKPKVNIRTKALLNNIKYISQYTKEVIENTDFRNTKRLKQLILGLKSKYESYIVTNGHSMALNRISCYTNTKESKINDLVSGVGFYRFLNEVVKSDDNINLLKQMLITCMRLIFNKNNLSISTTINNESYKTLNREIKIFCDSLTNESSVLNDFVKFNFNNKIIPNEGFVTNSKVQYNVSLIDFNINSEKKFCYKGSMKVLTQILNTEYLMKKVRLEGGSYGCHCGFKRVGKAYFYSYRDPHIGKTFEAYDKVFNFINNINLSKRELEKMVVGTLNKLDKPIFTSEKGELALKRHFCEVTNEDLQRERDEILNITLDELQSISELFENFKQNSYKCTFGEQIKIKESKNLFGIINLYVS